MPSRRLAAFYDIHGNLPALEAALAEALALGVDEIVFGGDLAAGPWPVETIARVRALEVPARFVRGNADRWMVECFDTGRDGVDAWAASRMGRAERDFLAGFEPAVSLEVDGIGSVLFCHGSPRSDEEIITALTDDAVLINMLADVPPSLIVCGHTHMQFDRQRGAHRIINAGSVGMPYGEAGAFWLLLGPRVELRRTEYDVQSTAATIAATDYPDVRAMAAGLVAPPSRDVAIEHFEKMAGRGPS